MRLLYEVAAGMVTQRPQGEPLSRADVINVQWLQRAVGRVFILEAAPVMFSGAVLSELVQMFF